MVYATRCEVIVEAATLTNYHLKEVTSHYRKGDDATGNNFYCSYFNSSLCSLLIKSKSIIIIQYTERVTLHIEELS